ncbi:MAG TPA: hypothetical protein PLY59_07600 [Clostridiales bacterium]|mgnify:CR=1 FL=1|nr:hypothetical protein [Clostridiales bacterium]
MKTGRTLQELAIELDRQLKAKRDYLVDTPALRLTPSKVVELSAKEFGLTQEESNGVLGHLIQGGDLSLYGLANAVTRHSQDVKSYDRATELEAAGWSILNMSPSLWRQLNTAR